MANSRVWSVCKVDIAEAAASLSVGEPLTSPTKISVLLTELNTTAVYTLTTYLATEISRKCRRTKASFATKAEIVPGSDLETDAEEDIKNHSGTVSLPDSAPPKKNKQNGMWASYIRLVLRGLMVTLC